MSAETSAATVSAVLSMASETGGEAKSPSARATRVVASAPGVTASMMRATAPAPAAARIDGNEMLSNVTGGMTCHPHDGRQTSVLTTQSGGSRRRGAADLVGKILSGIKAQRYPARPRGTKFSSSLPRSASKEWGTGCECRRQRTAGPSPLHDLVERHPHRRERNERQPAGCRCKSPAGARSDQTSRGTSRRAFPRSTLLRSSPLNTVATPLVCSAPVR